ncbi:hypothetical protein [Actinokineospora sp.]|uniref:hypothetical protein n=1 Tax=Actinokineospora sp. TaxID=1872133 RepID=UPI003D6AB060
MAEETVPGGGPTTVVSVSMHAGTIAAVRGRTGKRGVSAYIEAAVQRQIERDNLDELIAAAEAEHGPIAEEQIADKRKIIAQAREQHRAGKGSAA